LADRDFSGWRQLVSSNGARASFGASSRSRDPASWAHAAVHGLQTLPNVRLTSLPRMADFALWATACGIALWPAGTFARAYDANRLVATIWDCRMNE
jgi:hypothetical protein